MSKVNALCFGGGGLVGTSKSLGHLLGLDQLVRDPSSQKELKKSFFDYMVEAGVGLDNLEARFLEVMESMPAESQHHDGDHISRYFNLCLGISGGSLLAAGVASGLPLNALINEVIHFPVTKYFQPDFMEYFRVAKNLPKIPLNLLRVAYKEARNGLQRGPGEGLLLPTLRRISRVGFEFFAATGELLPRGLFSGEGIEDYIEELGRRYGFCNSFDDVNASGRHLRIIAERFNTANRLGDFGTEASAVYFGAPPHDRVPLSWAIRASCSIPGITTPTEYCDPERGGTRYQLVDGAIGKTIGRRRIFNDFDVGVAIAINPIVPYIGQLDSIIDNMEQLYRKLIYSRLKAVEGHIEPEVARRTIHIESNPDDFFYNMLRFDKMKEGLFEGYFQTLQTCGKRYAEMEEKLARGGLCLIPRNEIFRILNNNSLTRERTKILRRAEMSKEGLGVQLGDAFGELIRANEDAA